MNIIGFFRSLEIKSWEDAGPFVCPRFESPTHRSFFGPASRHIQSANWRAPLLDLRLLGHLAGIIDLDPKIPHCALELAVPKQQLNRPQVLRPAVDQ